MKTTIEFNGEFLAQSLVDIPDVGDFALEAYNEKEGYFFYLMIKTSLGISSVVSYGPVVPQVALLPKNYSVNYFRVEYKEKKIISAISKWINDRDKGITEAKLIDEKTFFEEFRDIKSYLECYGEDIY